MQVLISNLFVCSGGRAHTITKQKVGGSKPDSSVLHVQVSLGIHQNERVCVCVCLEEQNKAQYEYMCDKASSRKCFYYSVRVENYKTM